MPIRLNLLAEAQAAEEIRRRDPVKRAIWVAIVIVAGVLCWSSLLQARIITDNSRLSNLSGKLNSRTNQYTQILADKQHLVDASAKLAALNRFATKRFLQANELDSMQRAMVDGIHVVKLATAQSFDVVPETKPSVSETGKTVPGKPGRSIEKTRLIIDARDTSPSPGSEQINRFKETLVHRFQSQQVSSNAFRLVNLATPAVDNESGKLYVQFNLECSYPDRAR
jgi:hypothetical protein